MAARIGGDHGAIIAAGSRFDATGDEALGSAGQASGYSEQMSSGLDEITTVLKGHFEESAAALKQQIVAAHNRLESSDWAGSSREQAGAAEAALHAEVDQILDHALTAVEAFRQMVTTKAEEFRGAIEGEFKAILADLQEAYRQAGQASRQFAENLAAADQTIRFGG